MNPDSLSDSASYERWPSASQVRISTLWHGSGGSFIPMILGSAWAKGSSLTVSRRSSDILDRGLVDLQKPDRRATTDIGRLAPKRVAFVYPGLGNRFAGMGRDLAAFFPEVLCGQDVESGFLREQLDPCVWWQDELATAFSDHRVPIAGSVSVGALVTDVLRRFGAVPRRGNRL